MAKTKKMAIGGMGSAMPVLKAGSPQGMPVAQTPALRPTPMAAPTGRPTPNIGGAPKGAPIMQTPVLKQTPTGGRMKAGGKVSSASKRADGVAQRGKTKGKFV